MFHGLVGKSFVAGLIILIMSFTCGDPEEVAMHVCNTKNIDVIVYGFYWCNDGGEVEKYRIAVHSIRSGECIYFTDLAWECQLSWWDYWLKDAGCDEFRLVYLITKQQKYDMDMWEITNVRMVAIDSFVLTRDSIEKILPDCQLDI